MGPVALGSLSPEDVGKSTAPPVLAVTSEAEYKPGWTTPRWLLGYGARTSVLAEARDEPGFVTACPETGGIGGRTEIPRPRAARVRHSRQMKPGDAGVPELAIPGKSEMTALSPSTVPNDSQSLAGGRPR
jgi:hypothetical protein